jgi:hypothetical protein
MFYEIFLILVGVYLEQNYHLPSIALNLHRIQRQYQRQNQGNEQGENFLQDLYKSLFSKKK